MSDKDSRVNLRLTHQLKKLKAFDGHCGCDCVRCRQKVTEKGSCYCTDCGKRETTTAAKPTT
jgi:hypothetical protein